MMLKAEKDKLLELAKQVARLGGEEALKYFRKTNLDVKSKSLKTFDPVTQADLASEEVMTKLIKMARPDDSVIGEEKGATPGSSPYSWVLDPIDGTRAFISGSPVWTVLVSLNKNNKPILGIIYQPFTREMFIGGLGVSQFIGDKCELETKSRYCPKVKDSILFSTFPEIGTRGEQKAFNFVSKRAKLTRFGMDAYAFGLLAAGHIDIVIEAGLKNYDICAPIAVIEAAGGVVTNWAGEKIINGGKVLACGDKTLHAEVVSILSGKG